MAVYLTSDIHGKFDCLKKLLDKVQFSDRDWLYIIGDCTDRHNKGGVDILVWLLYQPNVELILGNHEAFITANRWLFEELNEDNLNNLDSKHLMLLSTWQSNGGDITIKSLSRESAETRKDILDYLDDCPLYETVEAKERKYILAHGGLGNFRKDKRLEEYSPEELLWCRPSLSATYLPSEYTVIVGHTPTIAYGEKYKNRMIKTESFWNIDTGAALDYGRPMLLCLDTLKEYYIEDDGRVIEQ